MPKFTVTLDQRGIRSAVMDLGAAIARGEVTVSTAKDVQELEVLAIVCENHGLTHEASRVRSWLKPTGSTPAESE
jgi:hypothetical protein